MDTINKKFIPYLSLINATSADSDINLINYDYEDEEFIMNLIKDMYSTKDLPSYSYILPCYHYQFDCIENFEIIDTNIPEEKSKSKKSCEKWLYQLQT